MAILEKDGVELFDAEEWPFRAQELETFLWEMEQLEFEAKKTELLDYTFDQEIEAYERLHADIGKYFLISCLLSNVLVNDMNNRCID